MSATNWKPLPPPSFDQLSPRTGEYLTALCAASGRTQEDIANQLGMVPRVLRLHLNGQRKTDFKLYQLQYAIEGAVGATVVWRVRRRFGLSMPRIPN